MVALLIFLGASDGDTEIETERGSSHKEAETEAEIIVVTERVEVVGAFIHEAAIIEEGEANRADDINGVFGAKETVRFTTNGLAKLITGTHFAIFKPAEGVGPAKVE